MADSCFEQPYVLKMMNDVGYELSVDHSLHLYFVAGGDVGQKPHCFLDSGKVRCLVGFVRRLEKVYLLEFLSRMLEQLGEVGKRAEIENELSLLVRSSHDVPYGSQG